MYFVVREGVSQLIIGIVEIGEVVHNLVHILNYELVAANQFLKPCLDVLMDFCHFSAVLVTTLLIMPEFIR